MCQTDSLNIRPVTHRVNAAGSLAAGNPSEIRKLNGATKASKLAEAKINALKEQQIRRLREKLIHKNEVIAELMEENAGRLDRRIVTPSKKGTGYIQPTKIIENGSEAATTRELHER